MVITGGVTTGVEVVVLAGGVAVRTLSTGLPPNVSMVGLMGLVAVEEVVVLELAVVLLVLLVFADVVVVAEGLVKLDVTGVDDTGLADELLSSANCSATKALRSLGLESLPMGLGAMPLDRAVVVVDVGVGAVRSVKSLPVGVVESLPWVSI